MANAGGIRAGRAFVEIGLNGLEQAKQRLAAFGQSVQSIGSKVSLGGIASSIAPALSAKTFADTEQALANLRAAANPTAEQFDRIKEAVKRVATETGQAPTAVIEGFSELLKAGMDVEQVLGGAGEAAVKFAKVGEIEVAEAATTMTDALNVFAKDSLSAAGAVDILSKAADASSVSIAQVTQAFSASSAVFANAGQSMQDLTSAIGILGNAGVKGSDAGTSLKTMLLRLQTGAETAGEVMQELGIKVRDANGDMLPMRAIIAELQAKFSGLSGQAKDQAMAKLFGTDAIRAGAILLEKGAAGWDAFNAKLGDSLGVGQKFAIMQDTLLGDLGKTGTSIMQVGNSIGSALVGPVRKAIQYITGLVQSFGAWVDKNREVVVMVGAVVAGVLAGGVALTSLGIAIRLVAASLSLAAGPLKLMVGLLGFLANPITMVVAALGTLAGYILYATGAGGKAIAWLSERFDALKEIATTAFGGIRDAIAAGDLALAARVLWAGLRAAFLEGVAPLRAVWQQFTTWFRSAAVDAFFGTQAVWETVQSGLTTAWIETVAVLESTWAKFSAGMRQVWEGTQSWLEGQWLKLFNQFGNLTDEELQRAQDMAAKQNAANKKQIDDDKNARLKAIEDERAARRAQNDKEHQNEMGRIADEGSAAMKNVRDLDAEERQKAADDLAAAKRDLADSVAAAKKKREDMDKEKAAGGPEAPPAPPKPPDVAAGIAEAMAKTTAVRGVFNKAALQSLQAGGPMERTAKATEATAKNTKKLVDSVGNLAGEFA